jgi:hypothetical protein
VIASGATRHISKTNFSFCVRRIAPKIILFICSINIATAIAIFLDTVIGLGVWLLV